MRPSLTRRLIGGYCAAAAAVAALIFVAFGLSFEFRAEWFLLPGLALLAEFLPVELSRRGIRITFALPYVAGIALVAGPAAAVFLEVVVSVSVAIALVSSGRSRTASYWMAANTAISILCAAAAGVALHFGPGSPALQGLTFTVVYACVNCVLVIALDYYASGRKLSDNLKGSLGLGLRAFALYGLIAMAVCVLVSEDLALWTALTLLPVLVLRAVLMLQQRAYEHYYDTITAFTLMLQGAHPYTHGHLERVSRVAEEVALKLGLPAPRARMVREAAVLHDIGKIAVDEEVLDAPRRLTEEEMDHVRRHSALGAEILVQVPQFVEVSHWILHHHERPDGQGYPFGLSGHQIPIESKIIAVADAYDAMTGGDAPADRRLYKEPMTRAEALAELHRCSGSQFDPLVVDAFHEVLAGGAA